MTSKWFENDGAGSQFSSTGQMDSNGLKNGDDHGTSEIQVQSDKAELKPKSLPSKVSRIFRNSREELKTGAINLSHRRRLCATISFLFFLPLYFDLDHPIFDFIWDFVPLFSGEL